MACLHPVAYGQDPGRFKAEVACTVAAGLECHRANVLYKFALAPPDLVRVYEFCKDPKDKFRLRPCCFDLLGLNARLELDIDQQGCRPVVYAALTSEPSKKRMAELTQEAERLTTLPLLGKG